MRRAQPLTEKYRPKRLEQIRGHDDVVSRLKRILDREQFDGGAFWLEGASGTGKGCFAWSIATRKGIESREAWNYTELDGDKCSVAAVRDLDGQTSAAGLFADEWRVIVVNESHLMTTRAVGAWLTLLERLPYRWIIVFTTTENSSGLFGPMGKPLVDRCIGLRLSSQGLAPVFARLAHGIARREGLDGQPVSTYENALRRSGVKNSMRALLQRIARMDFCS